VEGEESTNTRGTTANEPTVEEFPPLEPPTKEVPAKVPRTEGNAQKTACQSQPKPYPKPKRKIAEVCISTYAPSYTID
jgi:hypothetical protein